TLLVNNTQTPVGLSGTLSQGSNNSTLRISNAASTGQLNPTTSPTPSPTPTSSGSPSPTPRPTATPTPTPTPSPTPTPGGSTGTLADFIGTTHANGDTFTY